MHTGLGGAMGMIPKRKQGRNVAVGYQPDVATVATIAPIGTATGDVGFTTK